MNRLVFILALAGCLYVTIATDFSCEPTGEYPKEVCFIENCTNAIKSHVKYEFDAAFKYMYMGAFFGQEEIDRPGLYKFLLEAASEERGHAIQMLDYLNLRGIKIDGVLDYSFVPSSAEELKTEYTYKGALVEALNMEIKVTKLIYDVVNACEKDFHGADVFTNPILDEQHDGVRKLQGAIKTFDDLAAGSAAGSSSAALAEYLFDKKMMSGEF